MKKDKEYDAWAHLRVKNEDDIPDTDYWNLEDAATLFIAPRLRLLVKGMTKYGCVPGSFISSDDCSLTINEHAVNDSISPDNSDKKTDDDFSRWHEVLKKMQYAFDTLENNIGMGDGIYHLDKFSDKQEKAIQEGLELFAKNYFDLWY